MQDSTTQARILIHNYENSSPYFMVPVSQLNAVKELLDQNSISYNVDQDAISFDDKPAVTVITLSRSVDVQATQSLLDSVP